MDPRDNLDLARPLRLLTAMRLAIGIEYDGSHYSGWQTQKGRPTIQACVESAAAAVAGHPVRMTCAGRTDAAVHATGQVAHFDSSADRAEHNWLFGCNANLAPDVRVLWVRRVEPSFHARYSAVSRRYLYFIGTGSVRRPLSRQRIAWCFHDLDVPAMAAAAEHLVGEHDFSSFRSSGCQARSPVRRVSQFAVTRRADLVVLEIRANAFLHHMVRNLAGLLLSVGTGKHPPEWAKTVLDARDRRRAEATAPPQGLYLVEVSYPDHYGLPASRPPALVI